MSSSNSVLICFPTSCGLHWLFWFLCWILCITDMSCRWMNCGHNSNILYLLSLTGPPSSPRSPVPQVNDTSLTLEWSEPLDCGGRSDLTYSVECRMCSTPRGPCMPCGDGVNYLPSQTGIQGRRLSVWGLRPHTTYSFTVMALNGVSPLSQQGHAGETVNITTSPNGETVKVDMNESCCFSWVC